MALPEYKAEVFKHLHQLANCHQAVIGYFELNEYERARILAMECQAEWSLLIQRLSSIIEDN